MTERRLSMADVIQFALEQGREVRLTTDSDGYGFHVEIDGQRLTEFYGEGVSDGYPWETLEAPLFGRRRRLRGGARGSILTEDAMDLAHEIMTSGERPRCPECYGWRTEETLTRDGEEREVIRCQRCGVTRPVGEPA